MTLFGKIKDKHCTEARIFNYRMSFGVKWIQTILSGSDFDIAPDLIVWSSTYWSGASQVLALASKFRAV
jgi:hypothetical protein